MYCYISREVKRKVILYYFPSSFASHTNCISKHTQPWHLPSLGAKRNTGSDKQIWRKQKQQKKSWKEEKEKLSLLYLNSSGKVTPPLSPNKTATPERKREKSMEWEREAGEKGVEEAFRESEKERDRGGGIAAATDGRHSSAPSQTWQSVTGDKIKRSCHF